MQPILTAVASAFGFAITLWIVRSALRSIFHSKAQSSLGVVLIAAGIWLFFFRVVALAIPLLILGTILLLPRNATMDNATMGRGSTARTSRVRSAHLEMTLDHETGNIDGRILTGKRQGQVLSDLTLHELLRYHAEVQTDQETVKLFETFLDSAHPDWRDQMDESAARGEKTSPLSRQLSRDEAYRLLGLELESSEKDIREAYHRLIMRVHPDSGGSAALTAQITEARDRLLGDRQ
ncbi:MAG: DnaJ domain-containing protein [Rhodobacteraceae bacterium]|nr:DnaJ domain-containing protein [Paracoccaceae bacterium]